VSHPLRTFLAILVVLGAARGAAARSLRDDFAQASQSVGISPGSAFNALADSIAGTVANNIPTISASAGFTYRYNPTLEVFERSSDTLGPIFLERPDTLGQGKFNVNVSYQWVEFNTFDGVSLSNLQGANPIVLRTVNASGNLVGFTADRLQYRLGLHNNIVAFSFTYGILDNLDVNLLLPLIATSLNVGVTRQQLQTAGPDGVFSPNSGPPVTGRSSGDAFGAGDLLMRFKYELPQLDWFRSAVGLQFRFPSGRVDDFQGTGDFWITPAFYASTLLWSRVEPYVNAAIDIDTIDTAQSQARYGAGFDVDVIPRLGLTFAFLGRSQFERPTPANETNFLYLTPTGTARLPLLGIDLGRKDFFDFSFGFRANVWEGLMLFANGIYAMNSEGLRNSTIIPTVGLEGTF
jgi:hypothetical protein